LAQLPEAGEARLARLRLEAAFRDRVDRDPGPVRALFPGPFVCLKAACLALRPEAAAGWHLGQPREEAAVPAVSLNG
jgi:hypothetical protein